MNTFTLKHKQEKHYKGFSVLINYYLLFVKYESTKKSICLTYVYIVMLIKCRVDL